MPIEIVPDRIDLTDLTAGYMPDPTEAAVPANASPDVSNLLPMPSGTELRLRNGYTRETSGTISSLVASHVLRDMSYYEVVDSGVRKRYLMCILTDSSSDPDNVQIYAYDLKNNTFTRKDTPSRTWTNPRFEWWTAVIEGTWYAGTHKEEAVSWHPTDGYDADPLTPTADDWVNNISPGAGEKAKDYAYKKGNMVEKSSRFFRAARDIRFETWDDDTDTRYKKNNKVSRKTAIGGYTYWRSYECIQNHAAADVDADPGTGAVWKAYWKRIKLDSPLDTDGDVTDDWIENPIPSNASVGTYHGNRLFLRRGDDDNWTRLQYSAPAIPEKHAVISDLDWDPTDWAPVDDLDGDGGGWFTVPFSGKGDAIRALQSFGNYLIIAGRWQSYVLAGVNEATWILRKLGNYGAMSSGAITELDGMVYMLDRKGILTRTDGTTIEPVPGMEGIRKYLKDKCDHVIFDGGEESADLYNWFPNLISHDGFLFLSLPHPTAGHSRTIVYDPRTSSFWELDIPMLGMAVGEDTGVERLWFSTSITGAAGQIPAVFRYLDDPGQEVYTDDDWDASGTVETNDITWGYRTAWFQFGATRNERRLRRVWALVSGETGDSVTVATYRNFEDGSTRTTASRTFVGTAEAEFVEGKVGSTTLYSVGVKVSGAANAKTSVHGFGVDTQRVRTRYKRDH